MGELNLNNYGKPTQKEMEEARLKQEVKLRAGAMEKVSEETTGSDYKVDERTGLVEEQESIKEKLDKAGLAERK